MITCYEFQLLYHQRVNFQVLSGWDFQESTCHQCECQLPPRLPERLSRGAKSMPTDAASSHPTLILQFHPLRGTELPPSSSPPVPISFMATP